MSFVKRLTLTGTGAGAGGGGGGGGGGIWVTATVKLVAAGNAVNWLPPPGLRVPPTARVPVRDWNVATVNALPSAAVKPLIESSLSTPASVALPPTVSWLYPLPGVVPPTLMSRIALAAWV